MSQATRLEKHPSRWNPSDVNIEKLDFQILNRVISTSPRIDAKTAERTVVMACIHPYWSALQVGSQHIARELARRGWRIIYVSAPVTPFHLLKFFAFEVRQRFAGALKGGSFFFDGRIEAREPLAVVCPDGRSVLRHEFVGRHWWRTCLRGRIGTNELRDDTLLYIDNPVHGYLLEQNPNLKSIFRVADNHDRFDGWDGKLRSMSAAVAQSASVTVFSANSLEEYVASLSPKRMALVENGVDFEAFRFPYIVNDRPETLSGIPSPIILYVGAVDGRIDFELLHEVARRMPTISFVLVGPAFSDTNKFSREHNIYFTGPVEHFRLPCLMQYAAAGMAPFNVSSFEKRVEGVRSLKILEYLAAGLPVIAARWAESERNGLPVWLYRDVDEFIALVRRAARGDHDPEPGWRYARNASWRRAVGKMLSILDRND